MDNNKRQKSDVKTYNPKRKPKEARARFEREAEFNDRDIKRYNPKRKNPPKKKPSTQNPKTKVRIKKEESSSKKSNKVVKFRPKQAAPPKKKRRRRPIRKTRLLKKILKRLLIVLLVFSIIGGSATFLYVRSIVSEMPVLTKRMVQESFINKEPVPLADIPKTLQEAVVSVEDRRFYKHKGVDKKAIIRSFVNNIKGEQMQGGSTIDMQLSKNLLTSNERTMKRKIQDMYNAIQINKLMTKDEILAAYLNNIYLGKSAYGVQAGAQLYFGKDVSKLNFGQCTMLAGITNNPRLYQDYEEAKKRQAVVLYRMYKQGYIKKYVYKAQLYRDTPFKSEID